MGSLDTRFEDMRKRIIEKLSCRKEKRVYDEDLLVFGLTSRALALYEGMEGAIGNPYVFVVLYRSQMETLATINHLNRHPEDAERFLHGGRKTGRYRISNILTLLDSCSKRYPGLRDIYDEISEMAHPNAASHFLSIDKDGGRIRWRSSPSFSGEEKGKALKGQLEMNTHILDELDLLISALIR